MNGRVSGRKNCIDGKNFGDKNSLYSLYVEKEVKKEWSTKLSKWKGKRLNGSQRGMILHKETFK